MRVDLVELRPPLHNGGHCFVMVGDHLWRCLGCCGLVPTWALREGFVAVLVGRWCPGLFPALTPATGTPAGK